MSTDLTAPASSSAFLSAATGMGPVTLRVGDLDGMIRYYRDGVTLDLLSHDGPVAVLGRGTVPVIILQHAPELRNPEPRSAGLYHSAVLFESREALAAAVYSVAAFAQGSFTGSADHRVSIAFYFTDPEGNGVELYWDRDRTEWSWVHGQIEMATLYVDPNGFLQEFLTPASVEEPRIGGASVGHVHLSVGDVQAAAEFYVRRLGFESTFEVPGSALFVSAGKYHHHMAMNTWESRGAGRRQLALGLAEVDIVVPSADDVAALEERLGHYREPFGNDGRSLLVDDPWGNRVRVSAATAAG
ncbi:VOC family protein [Subtercola boreus]|uniref:Glyoxalase n=1 Tax=Subtercola boreus TaxID=120213 RepID=A0A3E0W7T0_9MICO|nr:VOC family protein [Subtercola boreus]RFA17964.1 glyoxalase [Subtercola boreus]RFA18346.1 glyoxalase [Subtercola boreus]RFA24875.1 glyoxalase [Subtercola boreus]